MIVVLEPGVSDELVAEVLAELEALGLEGRRLTVQGEAVVHVFGGRTRPARALLRMDQVVALVPTSGPRVRATGRRFYPYHFIHLAAVSLVLLGTLIFLAGFFPPGLSRAIDVQQPVAQPSAYLAAVERFHGLFPAGAGWLSWLAALALLAFVLGWPWIDRTRGNRLRDRWPLLVLVLLALSVVLYLFLGKGPA